VTGRREAAQSALRLVRGLHEDFHEPILHELDAQGLLDGGKVGIGRNGDAKVHAVDNANRLAQVEATRRGLEQAAVLVARDLAQIGVALPKPGSKLDPFQVSAAAKSAGRDPSWIMMVKARAARCGLLD
jgi:hypothetical protein